MPLSYTYPYEREGEEEEEEEEDLPRPGLWVYGKKWRWMPTMTPLCPTGGRSVAVIYLFGHRTTHAVQPTPYAPCRTPHAVRPTPYALGPTPHDVRPMPYALCCTPHTIRPTPYAPRPMPYLALTQLNSTRQKYAIILDLSL
jgi:hypothetical protein